MYKEKIDQYMDDQKEQMVEDLKTLIRIDSQRTEAKPGKPFGEGAAKVLEAGIGLMEKVGLKTKNYENYVITGDLYPDKEKQLDILAHLDVVPVSEDWTVTNPFEPKVVDGKIYGRGTADDKGPAIAALYALKAVKELGIPLKKGVRLILGADEECGSSDLKYYYGKEKEAPMSFTPDADFPLINLEKGALNKSFEVSFEAGEALPKILSVDGGLKVNVVPGKATAIVEGILEDLLMAAAKEVEEELQVQIQWTELGSKTQIDVKGVSAHASTPEQGINAVTALLVLLKKLPFAPCEGVEKLNQVLSLFPHGETDGASLGVKMEDELSGALTMNLGIFHYEETHLEGIFDSRIPVCGNDENMTKVVTKSLEENGFSVESGNMSQPHYVDPDSYLVQTLLGCYETYTGIKGKPLAIGGGTYVHHLKNGVAFGCAMPGVDNFMHGDNEFMELDTLFMSAKIFANAIVELCGVEESK